MPELRILLYGITATCCIALAYQLLVVKNTLARMFGVLLTAVALNALALCTMVVIVYHTERAVVSGIFTLNATLMALVSIALLLVFYNETRNGRYP